MTAVVVLLVAMCALNALFVWRWFTTRRYVPSGAPARPGVVDALIGFVTNFFDTLGIGSFAPTTAMFKLGKRVSDENIPGTLNVGQALPTAAEGLIFIALVDVDTTTLIGMIAAAVCGAVLGARVVAGLSRRAIQLGMGAALLVAAMIFLATNLHILPGGGTALQLEGSRLAIALTINFLLGALMTLGIGLYAPCLILLSLLGMNPIAAFPIMMGSCACLMPVAGIRFVVAGRYSARAALGLALGGIPGVLIAAFIVKSLPIEWLRWLVLIVVIYAAALMLNSARRDQGYQSN
jgi:uncharacterized membrane protein YfcA